MSKKRNKKLKRERKRIVKFIRGLALEEDRRPSLMGTSCEIIEFVADCIEQGDYRQ